MTVSGIPYITSKKGIVRGVIVVFGCIAFFLVIMGDFPESIMKWVMSAYVMTWCCSLASFIIIAANLSSKLQCKISFDTIDGYLSVFCCFYCMIATFVLTMYLRSRNKVLILADFIALILSISYAVEVYFLLENIPESLSRLKYLKTKNGIVKTSICIVGCTSVALLDAAIYRCYFPNGCDVARTWAFTAYVYCWSITFALLLLRLSGFDSKISVINRLEVAWSIFSLFNYLTAASLVAYYMYCPEFDGRYCNRRLASVIFGTITAALYLVEVIFLRSDLIEETSPKS